MPTAMLELTSAAAQVLAVSAPQDRLDMEEMISNLVINFQPMGSNRVPNSALYEQDFFAWTQTTANLVRAGRWYDVDLHTLVEEITSLGISQKHALGSHLKNLVMHLLKWYYQPGGRQIGHSWWSSIYNARDEIAIILEDSPSLHREVPGLLARRYHAARMLAHVETGLPLVTFPQECPWQADQILDNGFWPEG